VLKTLYLPITNKYKFYLGLFRLPSTRADGTVELKLKESLSFIFELELFEI